MNKLKISTIAFVMFMMGVVLLPAVFAASLLPPQILDLLNLMGVGGICATDYINSRVQLAMFLVLGGLVLISVIYALIAAFKYIRSEGDPGEMEKAQKSIKAIFFGIAAMVIAIVGIVLVFVIFGAKPTNPELFQTCISAPESQGCKSCREDTASDLCIRCEDAYQAACETYRGQNVTDAVIKAAIPTECKTLN
ncbi:MAG TPA: hypothetical protein PKU95_00835 [Candidatus Dojkabacteria bacterium]|jgi:hypothetical protein|nr:hypothetical protein [Candidatus Dojkabacteria bacterium]